MKNRIVMILGGTALFVLGSSPSFAAELKAIVSSSGRVVYTNVIEENVPVARSLLESPGGISNRTLDPINALIESISGNHGVDPALVRAMVKAESNFNRWAVSNKGALGLMQLIPNTGARYGVRDFFDPEQNIEGGVRYVKFLLEKFKGNLDLSLAAYNAGENLVERLGRIPSIPETQDYVRKVRANYGKTSASAALASAAASATAVAAKPEPQPIFRTVDERGVIHFSNIAPPK